MKTSITIAASGLALAACSASATSHTVPPQAKASAKATVSQIGRNIAHGQARQQAEGIVSACFKNYSGTGLIRCILPHATHRKVFTKCAFNAFGADIPGREVTFVQVDLPECLLKAR